MSPPKPVSIDLDFLISKSFPPEEVDKISPEDLINRLYSQTKLDLSDCNISELSHLESMTDLKSLYLRNVSFCPVFCSFTCFRITLHLLPPLNLIQKLPFYASRTTLLQIYLIYLFCLLRI